MHLCCMNKVFAALPAGTDAGAVDKSMQRDLIEQVKEKKLIQTEVEDKKVNKDSIKKPEEKDMGDYIYNPKFKLNHIDFEGNTLYNDKVLQKFSESLVGQDIFMDDLVALTVKISRFYQSNGYLTSYAYIPEQEVTNGTVRIAISESKIDNILVQGNKWTSEKYLKKGILGTNSLKEGEIFNAGKLQLALRDLNQHDYVKGQVGISKNKDTDKTCIVLDVQDRFPVGFDINWDNYGRRLIGEQRANLILSYDNLTGHGDRIYGGTILSKGTTGALAGYQIPVGSHGTKLSFDYSYSGIRLGQEYYKDNITGKSKDYAMTLTHPLYRTPKTTLVSSLSFDALSSETKYNVAHSSNSYNLRVIRTGLYGMHDDNYGRSIASLGSDFGAKFLGASPNIENGPSSKFVKFKANLTRVQRLPHKSLVIARIDGQYSPNRMFAAEQMQLGGPFSVRGYEPGVILGDYGLMGSFETRTPVPYIKAILPKKLEHLEDKVKFVMFYDWGYVKEHGNMYDYPLNFLQSVGTGLHFYLNDYLSASCSVGIPVGQKRYQGADARLNFAINSEVDKFFFKPKERL